MKREVKNYIFIGLGFTIILLVILWDLLSTINWLIKSYNRIVFRAIILTNSTFNEMEIHIFGKGMTDISLLMDIIIWSLIFIVIGMVILKLSWSVKEWEQRKVLKN